jgi:hypothetical protein
MALDDTNVYLTNVGTPNNGNVVKVPKSGGAPVPLVTALSLPSGIAVNGTSAFFGSVSHGISSVPIGGGPSAIVVPAAAAPGGALEVAVDPDYIYWTNENASGVVMKATLDGGSVTTLASGLPSPTGFTIDSNFVYWSDSAMSGRIVKVSLGGGMLINLATNQNIAQPPALAVDALNAYWPSSGALMSVLLAGGTPTMVVPSSAGVVTVTVDDTFAYFGTSDGAIHKIPKNSGSVDGGSVVTLVPSSPATMSPQAMAVDAMYVYWITGDALHGVVRKIAK